ncbi:MAG: ATPase, T2SS/T4P/T4SS family, partial [Bilophila sp.]
MTFAQKIRQLFSRAQPPRTVYPVPHGYEGIPESIRGRVVLQNGTLHMSSELRGDLNMLSLVAGLRRRGMSQYEWHSPAEFDTQYANIVLTAKPENEEKQYAVDLIASAHSMKASDIHIIDRGTYTLVRFRIMGRLKDYTPLSAQFGKRLISCLYSSMGSSQSTSIFSPTERMDARIVNRDYLPPPVHSIRLHVEPTECTTGGGNIMLLRLLYDSTSASGTLEERTQALGFTSEQQQKLRFLTGRTGLTIISGPTG